MQRPASANPYASIPEADVTLKLPYGESNRRADSNKEFITAATSQHLKAWSEMILTRNLVTGGRSMQPFAGNGILSKFITELSTLTGKPPTLDALSVMIAYITAKEHGINVNHGFNLKLAAQDWKTWYVQPPATRACRISPPTHCGHHPSLLCHLPAATIPVALLSPVCRVLNEKTRKKGVLVDIVKQYLEDKKAERERRGSARREA